MRNNDDSVPHPTPLAGVRAPDRSITRGEDRPEARRGPARRFAYDADGPPAERFARLGRRLAECGDLFRVPGYANGLYLVTPGDAPELVRIVNGADLLAIIIDRLHVEVIKGGKPQGGRIPQPDLAAMLKANAFRDQFLELDRLITRPLYLPGYELPAPGYHDRGPGHRVLYSGPLAAVASEPEAIPRFLDVMAFKEEADRTNAVAAALTVQLRQLFPGQKPMVAATANKSHSGKDTVLDFVVGTERRVTVTYEPTDWAFQRGIVESFRDDPEAGVLYVENVRLDRPGAVMRSAFLERLLLDPEPRLHAVNAGPAFTRAADFVVVASTNDARFSPDLMNRVLPIRLEAVGDVFGRSSPIGNPKLDYLPANRERIAAELRGMVERWKDVGCPPDQSLGTSVPEWARAVGGILRVNGFRGFLGNLAERKGADDPVRNALGLLGIAAPGEWLTPKEWSVHVVRQGLVKALVTEADRDTTEGRARGVGVILSRHERETLTAETDDESVTLRVEKCRRRFGEPEAKTRYCFRILHRAERPAED